MVNIKKGIAVFLSLCILISHMMISAPSKYVRAATPDQDQLIAGCPILLNPGAYMICNGLDVYPFSGWAHSGTDIVPSDGDCSAKIISIADGEVIFCGEKYSGGLDTYGKHVAVRHVVGGRVYTSLYAHLSSIDKDLYVGKHISKGTELGVIGSTGNSTGVHLHLNITETSDYTGTSAIERVSTCDYFVYDPADAWTEARFSPELASKTLFRIEQSKHENSTWSWSLRNFYKTVTVDGNQYLQYDPRIYVENCTVPTYLTNSAFAVSGQAYTNAGTIDYVYCSLKSSKGFTVFEKTFYPNDKRVDFSSQIKIPKYSFRKGTTYYYFYIFAKSSFGDLTSYEILLGQPVKLFIN